MKMRLIFLSAVLAAITVRAEAQVETHHFDCNAGGNSARMVMNVERFNSSGRIFGPGPNPEITGVIPDGETKIWVEGTVNGAQGSYSFSGWAPFVDFVGMNGGGRFDVKFVLDERRNGVWAIVNPFRSASEQIQYWCQKIG